MPVLGVDQSLAHSGIVVVECDEGRKPVLLDKKMLNASGLVDGIENMLRRAEAMADDEWPKLLTEIEEIWGKCSIIHEMPTMSNRLQKPESSLLAALGLRISARRMGFPYVSVSATKAKAHFTGSGNARKAQMRERLWEQYPEFKTARLNEHQADAMALIITHHYPELSVKNRK